MDVEQDIAPPWKNNQPSCDIAPSIETYSLIYVSTLQQDINVPPHVSFVKLYPLSCLENPIHDVDSPINKDNLFLCHFVF
jgi:hypothetical protein